MKFAAYTEETIWAVEDDEAAASTEGEATMRENGASQTLLPLKLHRSMKILSRRSPRPKPRVAKCFST